MRGPRRVSLCHARFARHFDPSFLACRSTRGCRRTVSQTSRSAPPSADGATATGAAPMGCSAGGRPGTCSRGLSPSCTPARAGARARGGGTRGARRRGRGRASDDAAEPEPPADPEPEPEEGAGEAPGGRRGAPVDSGARRVPEAHGRDRRQGTRACQPELGRNHRSNRTFQKRVPFFFLSERGEPTAVFVISPRSAGPPTVSTPAALDPIRVTQKTKNKKQKTKTSLRLLRGWSARTRRKRTSTPRRRRRRRRSSARWRLPTPCTRCATG